MLARRQPTHDADAEPDAHRDQADARPNSTLAWPPNSTLASPRAHRLALFGLLRCGVNPSNCTSRSLPPRVALTVDTKPTAHRTIGEMRGLAMAIP
jgi:hypothetical protein